MGDIPPRKIGGGGIPLSWKILRTRPNPLKNSHLSIMLIVYIIVYTDIQNPKFLPF